MSTTISAKRIESDVHLKVTLQDSGVSIAWDSVDIKQVCMYSVEQHAFAGHCSFTVSGEDNKILLVTYPASEQLYTGDYRIVARLVLDGDEHTYDALAFTLKQLSDESGSITTEDVEVGIQVEEVNTTIMYEILTACQAATDSALAAEAAIEAAEAARVAAENLRVQAETAREAAEAARVQAETARVSAEASREEAEAARVQAEQARVSAEQLRATAETARVEAESARVTAEAARDAAEAARVQAETARVAAEQGRVSAEAARVQAESAREAAEAARVSAEAARVQAETAREAAEAARVQQAAADHTRAEADHTATEAAAAQAIAAAEAADQAREAIQDDLAKKANKDGSYSQMQVGSAENLIGQIPTSAFFTHRRTGNGIVGTGAAQFKELRGRTLVWNLLANTSGLSASGSYNGINYTYDADTKTITAVDGTATATSFSDQALGFVYVPLINGHKYYLGNGGGSNSLYVQVFSTQAGNRSYTTQNNAAAIFTNEYTANDWLIRVRIASGVTVNNDKFILQLIDLTDLFGAGNEPSTVAEFTALFPNFPYAYNAGTLLPFKGTGIKTVGFNQWDEQWELGNYNSGTGAPIETNYKIRSKNFIPVFGWKEYYFKSPVGLNLFFYDSEGNFISSDISYMLGNTVYTIPAGTAFMMFSTYGSTITTYNHDICINFSDSSINGQYFPYEEHTLSIPVVGKTAKDGNGNAIIPFPAGMHGTPTAFDLARKEDGSKVMAVVDLGDCTWVYAGEGTSTPFFYATIEDIKTPADANTPANIICGKYAVDVWAHYTNKTIKVRPDYPRVVVVDSAYTDADTFKASMAGVKLVYELATPVTFTWDEPLEMNFAENRMGTEELLPVGVDADGVPQTAPITAEIIYPIDATNTIIGLPKDYISAESFKNYLDARVAAGEIAAYTMTFNATTNKYDFTITRAS